MEGVLVRNLCSSSSATVPLVPPPRPSFLFHRKASFPPSNSTMFPLLSSLLSAPSRSFSSVIYATPDSQLSVGTDTDTREWGIEIGSYSSIFSLRVFVDSLSIGFTISEEKHGDAFGDVIPPFLRKSRVKWYLETYSGYNKEVVFQSIRPLLEPLITPATLRLQPVRELNELCQKQHFDYKKPVVSRNGRNASVTIEVEANGRIFKHTATVADKRHSQKN
ncbi:DICER-RELATED [Salix koriyanagi]|uniref:DICER-RELATED n=1 Tax=Salix koriyanagi TaxID=2511006 RepID=A0A9Q1AEL9_9ROSI|nr:DICER-RELATED [Salix koriyanagi]